MAHLNSLESWTFERGTKTARCNMTDYYDFLPEFFETRFSTLSNHLIARLRSTRPPVHLCAVESLGQLKR